MRKINKNEYRVVNQNFTNLHRRIVHVNSLLDGRVHHDGAIVVFVFAVTYKNIYDVLLNMRILCTSGYTIHAW